MCNQVHVVKGHKGFKEKFEGTKIVITAMDQKLKMEQHEPNK